MANDWYMWVQALHVISVIAWMAGMLYLPRLFVYHCEVEPGSAESERFKVMEYKLLRYITNPAMIAAWTFGLIMVFSGRLDFAASPWLHVKLLLVFFLSGVHGMLSKHRKNFANDANEKPARYFRILNEAPTLLMIFIVILVIVKPF